jgi:hypothetical protein
MVAKVAITTMDSPPPSPLNRDWLSPSKPRFPNMNLLLMSRTSGSKRVRSLGKLPTLSSVDLERSTGADIVVAALHVLVVSGNDSFSTSDDMSINPTTRMKKEVRFNTAENQVLLPSHELTEEEIEKSWWSHEEYSASLQKFRVSIQRFYDTQKDSVKQLNHLVSLCNQASSDTSLEDATARFLIVSECRGMEADLAPALKSSRRRHAAIVLEHLQKIPSRFPEDLRQRMLSARSRQLSRTHKVFARVLGDADQDWANAV